MPYRVVGAHGDTLFMIYDAGGALLQRKYVRDSLVLDKTDYLGGIEIRNDVDVVISLKFTPSPLHPLSNLP